VHKFYYIAAIFRYERKQKGRYRQHHQTGIELLGSALPEADVEVLHLGWTYLRTLGIDGLHLDLNSVGCPECRPRYREALREFLRPRLGALCPDCRRRFEVNILRVLDCKNEGCRAVTAEAPSILEYLCPACADHFEGVQRGLRSLDIPFALQPRLVRGLDYYTRTAFEISHPSLGAQNVVLGGGRYDGLVEECGGPPTPGVGFGCGVERTLLVLEALGKVQSEPLRPLVYVTAVTPEERALAHRSLKAQMRDANRRGAALVLFLRGEWLAENRLRVKWMADGQEEDWPLEELSSRLRKEGWVGEG
jgi:histidyl-tRNA synthetase